MKFDYNQMQTMDVGSAEAAALTQMSAVPNPSSSSYFLQLDPSGHIDILESSLVLSKPDMADETVYEIQLDSYMMDERNVEVVNLQNFPNAVTFQPSEFYDEHANLIVTSFNSNQIQYQIEDINALNQMLMGNAITSILQQTPPPPPVPIQESNEVTEVDTIPDFIVETEVTIEEGQGARTEEKPTPPVELLDKSDNGGMESVGEANQKEIQEGSEKGDITTEVKDGTEGTSAEEASSNTEKVGVGEKEIAPTKRKWTFPEKLWDFDEEPVMPPLKEIYPSKKLKTNELEGGPPPPPTSEEPEVITLSDNEPFDETESDTPKPFQTEFLYDGMDPDDELYISYLKRPDESKTALCVLCYEWFDTVSDLDTHLKEVHQDNMVLYGCKRCGKQFWSRFQRQRHEKMHRYDLKPPRERFVPRKRPFLHLDAKKFLQRLRRAPLTKDYIEQIRSVHSQVKSTEYECIQCGKDFQTEEEYQDHYQENHALQKCVHCEAVLENGKSLRKHEHEAHGIYQIKKNYPGGAWNLWETAWDLDELKEKDDKLVNLHLYHNYCKKTQGEKCSTVTGSTICEEVTEREYEASKKQSGKRKSNADKSGSNKRSSLSSPEKSRKNDPKSGLSPDEDYSRIEFMDDAKDEPPSGNSRRKDHPLKCNTCKTLFVTEEDLEQHIKTHTIRAMAYMCQYCGRGFATHSNRKEHERIHTGDKPYVCPICARAFVQISNLKKHIQTHKDKNNLQCSTCQKQFVKESSLLLHQRAHSQDRKFRCHICDRAYNYASLLKRHMRIHTGENPYSCEDCGMQFHELVSLHYHRKKVHTGERPHRCDLCGRAFILSSDLKKHIKIHERNNGNNGGKSPSSKSSNSKNSEKAKAPPLNVYPPKISPANSVGPATSTVAEAGFNNVIVATKSKPTAPENAVLITTSMPGQTSISTGGEGGHHQVLVINETDLLNASGKHEEVIKNDTKENHIQISSGNHIEPIP